jgi:hypothetical protein
MHAHHADPLFNLRSGTALIDPRLKAAVRTSTSRSMLSAA